MNEPPNSGGFFNNIGGIITAVILGTIFWPLLIRFPGYMNSNSEETVWNWLLQIAWIIFLVSLYIRHRRKRNR